MRWVRQDGRKGLSTDRSSDDERDRRVVEQIRGYPRDGDWPARAIPAGTRVRVTQDPILVGPWGQEFLGVVSAMGAPEPVRHPHARDGELAYWVAFDEPQLDSGGGAPYRKALIWDRYIVVAHD